MSESRYPYMPEGRAFRFVSANDPFMKEAARARQECSGDPLFPVGAVLVKDGRVVARAGNGYNRGSGTIHVCPRIVLDCPSGTGYDLCHLHDAPGHAEPMLIAAARAQGSETTGADVYLYGHWWCCEPCWQAMIDAGVRNVYLFEDAHEVFSRDRVYTQTLQSSINTVTLAGDHQLWSEGLFDHVVDDMRESDVLLADITQASADLEEKLGAAKQIGKPVVLISKRGTIVPQVAHGHPSVVYHVEYDISEEIGPLLRNVFKQL